MLSNLTSSSVKVPIQYKFTKTFTHQSIRPQPKILQAGKVVIIIGASSGIGAEVFAPAFAQAGARAVILVGRRADKIKEFASRLRSVYSKVEIFEVALSITGDEKLDSLFALLQQEFGGADVLINNAGVLSPQAEEVPEAASSNKHGTVIGISSGAATFALPGSSSYGTSKLAVNWLDEHIAVEYPHVTTITLDPGTPQLEGGAAVWLTTGQASFLHGRFVAANRSVDDLLARKEEIVAKNDLKVALRGKLGVAK